MTGFETNNHYVVKNSMGQQIFRVDEKTDMCMRNCCGKNRGFSLHMFDNMNREVMVVKREFKCCTGCNWCAGCCNHCAFEVVVEAPPGNPIGYTKQKGSFCRILQAVQNADRETVMHIRGPICPCGCSDVNFALLSGDESEELGMITKQWSGFAREYFTDADNFGITCYLLFQEINLPIYIFFKKSFNSSKQTVPMDLDVKMKANLLGTLFLIVSCLCRMPEPALI